MKHLNEEELIERYYGKGDGPASRHLEGCAACAEAYDALQRDLAGVECTEPPARDDSYGERVWQSLAPLLLVYEAPMRGRRRAGLWKGLSYAAACALLIAGAFIAGRQWEHGRQRGMAENNPAPTRQRVVLVVLSDHLDRTERLLVELKHADAGSAEMVSPLRDEARSLLAANDVCRQDAARNGDPELTAALDRLNPLLVELAGQTDGMNSATLARLQDQMNADGLLFEVRVLRSRIPDRQAAMATRPNGGTI